MDSAADSVEGSPEARQAILDAILSRRGLLGGVAFAALLAMVTDAAGPLSAHATGAPFPLTNWWGTVPSYNDTFDEHVARGSVNPGVDWWMPVGTYVKAPHDGSASFQSWGDTPGALWQVNIVHSTGWRSELLHVSASYGTLPRSVSRGNYVASSGGVPGSPGAGPSEAEHLHWTLKKPDGTRVDPLLWVNTNPDGSPTGSQWRQPMAMLFLKGSSTAPYVYALAGLGQAEAGWIEMDGAFATAIVNAMGGPTSTLTDAQWNLIKAAFVAQY